MACIFFLVAEAGNAIIRVESAGTREILIRSVAVPYFVHN